MNRHLLCYGFVICALSACQMQAGIKPVATPQPAVRTNQEMACQQELSQALTQALGSPVTVSQTALTQSSQLSLERKVLREAGQRLDGSLRAGPLVFNLVMREQQCLLQQRGSDWQMPLQQCRCRVNGKP